MFPKNWANGLVRNDSDMNEIVIFESDAQQVEVRLEGETLWLSLQQLAIRFGRDKSVISRHLKNIFDTNGLNRRSVVAKNATVQQEGDRGVVRQVDYYNRMLDVLRHG